MKKLALVLGSGGARGFAHLGVLRAMEDNGLVPDYVIGSSVGSLVGSFFCKFADHKKTEEALLNIDWKELSSLLGINIKGGVLSGKKIRNQLNLLLDNPDFKDLKIPLETVATNFYTAESVYFNKGSVAEGVQASIAFPTIIEPLKKDNDVFWDGGLSNPLPINRAKKKNTVVVAVNLDRYPQSFNTFKKMSVHQITESAIRTLQHHMGLYSGDEADILLEPQIGKEDGFLGMSGFLKNKQRESIIKIGAEITEKNIKLIKNKLK